MSLEILHSINERASLAFGGIIQKFRSAVRPLSGRYPVGVQRGITENGQEYREFYPCEKGGQFDEPWLRYTCRRYAEGVFRPDLFGNKPWWFIHTVQFLFSWAMFCAAPFCHQPLQATRNQKRILDENRKEFPFIFFSHGLYGMGDENAVLCTEWASHGFRVVAIHHTDGSSSYYRDTDGKYKWFQETPKDDSSSFRPQQVEKRAAQLKGIIDELQPEGKVNLAGYSYGASTSFLYATDHPERVDKLLSLDGWFHDDNRPFPPRVFESIQKKPFKFQTNFLSSKQFHGWKDNSECTKKLMGDGQELRMIPNTTHQNFNDIVFWFAIYSVPGLSKLTNIKIVGGEEACRRYYDIIQMGIEFFAGVEEKKPSRL